MSRGCQPHREQLNNRERGPHLQPKRQANGGVDSLIRSYDDIGGLALIHDAISRRQDWLSVRLPASDSTCVQNES